MTEFSLNHLICMTITHFSFYNVVFFQLYTFYLTFLTWIRSFHIALSQNSIRRRKHFAAAEYLSGGGIIIRGERGRARNSKKKHFLKSLTVPKIVAQCRKPTHSTHHYLNTLSNTYLTLIHRSEDSSQLSGPIDYLNTWGSHWLSCSPINYYQYVYIDKSFWSN